jgi:hypothetical protein
MQVYRIRASITIISSALAWEWLTISGVVRCWKGRGRSDVQCYTNSIVHHFITKMHHQVKSQYEGGEVMCNSRGRKNGDRLGLGIIHATTPRDGACHFVEQLACGPLRIRQWFFVLVATARRHRPAVLIILVISSRRPPAATVSWATAARVKSVKPNKTRGRAEEGERASLLAWQPPWRRWSRGQTSPTNSSCASWRSSPAAPTASTWLVSTGTGAPR